MLLLFGHVIGPMQGVCFMSILGLDLTLLEPQSRFGDKPLKCQVVCPQNETAVLKGLMSCIIHPSPSFSAWYVHQMSGILGIMSDQTSTAQWKSVKFYGYLTTRPNLHVNWTCWGDHAVSMCVHVRRSTFMLGFWSIFLSLYYQYYDTGETLNVFMSIYA